MHQWYLNNLPAFLTLRGCHFVVASGCRAESKALAIPGCGPWFTVGARGFPWELPSLTAGSREKSMVITMGHRGFPWVFPL